MRKRWTDEELVILKEKYALMPIEELAIIVGHPVGCLHAKASQLKIHKGHEINAIDRFMVKFAISDKEYEGTPCWDWVSVMSNGGYARLWFNNHYEEAHRWAYEYFVAPIPGGLVIDHLCNNSKCVNALHLKVTTQKDNVLRSNGLTAQNARKTHCKYGHEFTIENTRITKDNSRHCKTCERINYERYYYGQTTVP